MDSNAFKAPALLQFYLCESSPCSLAITTGWRRLPRQSRRPSRYRRVLATLWAHEWVMTAAPKYREQSRRLSACGGHRRLGEPGSVRRDAKRDIVYGASIAVLALLAYLARRLGAEKNGCLERLRLEA